MFIADLLIQLLGKVSSDFWDRVVKTLNDLGGNPRLFPVGVYFNEEAEHAYITSADGNGQPQVIARIGKERQSCQYHLYNFIRVTLSPLNEKALIYRIMSLPSPVNNMELQSVGKVKTPLSTINLSPADIIYFHKKVMGYDYVIDIPLLRKELEMFIQCTQRWNNIHPILKSWRMYQSFVTINPLHDGNHRVGNIIANINLSNYGFLPMSFDGVQVGGDIKKTILTIIQQQAELQKRKTDSDKAKDIELLHSMVKESCVFWKNIRPYDVVCNYSCSF